MKTILALFAFTLTLSACNSSEKIQLRAPQTETAETKTTASSDTVKLDSTASNSLKN